MVLMHVLNVHLGFSFSAGLFDYVLNFGRATNPLRLVPIGLAVLRAVLRGVPVCHSAVRSEDAGAGCSMRSWMSVRPRAEGAADRARGFIEALGGAGNLVTVDACTTRLRLVVARQEAVNVDKLKWLGARGVVRPSANGLQVVLGPIADQVAGDIRAALHAMGASSAGARRMRPMMGAVLRLRPVAASRGRLTRPHRVRCLAPLGRSQRWRRAASHRPTVQVAILSEPAVLDLARRLACRSGRRRELARLVSSVHAVCV